MHFAQNPYLLTLLCHWPHYSAYYALMHTKTSNVAIYGETGRYPICIHYMYRCVKYWLQLLKMKENSYPKCCYNMLYDLSEVGRKHGQQMIEIYCFDMDLDMYGTFNQLETTLVFLVFLDNV